MIGRTNASGSSRTIRKRFKDWLTRANYLAAGEIYYPGTYKMSDSGDGVWKFGNINVNSSESKTRFIPKFNCIVTVVYDISLELNYDFLTVNLNGIKTSSVINRATGKAKGTEIFEMKMGENLEFILTKDIDQSKVTDEKNTATIKIYVEEKR